MRIDCFRPGVIDSWVVPQDGSRGRFGPGPLPFTLPSPPPWPREPLRQNLGSCGPLMGQRDACSPFVPDTPLMRSPHKPSVPLRSKPELPTFPCLTQSPVSASDPGPPQRTLLTWFQAASKEPSALHHPGTVPLSLSHPGPWWFFCGRTPCPLPHLFLVFPSSSDFPASHVCGGWSPAGATTPAQTLLHPSHHHGHLISSFKTIA